MKVTCIGDIHGRKTWKDIVNKNKNSHFIFLGDYVDPYRSEFIEEEESIENFQEIIDFKSSNKDKVTLIIGNHDAQYLFNNFGNTNAISRRYYQEISDLYYFNKNLFQFAFQKDRYLFTHAGISNSWYEEFSKLLTYFGLTPDMSNIAFTINKIGRDLKWREVLGTTSHLRGGFDKNGGPLWADIRELKDNYLFGFHQVVGHNKVSDIVNLKNRAESITFVDCLWNKTDSLRLDI